MAEPVVREGFVPPPYPHDRLGELRAIAAQAPGGIIDASVGTPVDPTPDFVIRAATEALHDSTGYPATIGSPALREAAAGWIDRRFGVDVGADAVLACIGTKELVAGLPRLLSLRDPSRDTVLYPALAYPTYAMGATLAGLRAVPIPLGDDGCPDATRVGSDDAARALLLWCNDPANPTGEVSRQDALADAVVWARSYGILVASDECYAEFTYDEAGRPVAPVTALVGNHEGVLAVHSLSKRSNMAGFRVGFVAGDLELVGFLGEMRKHGGMMTPAPVQAAAVAALGDDAHVDEQRSRYARRRAALVPALESFGLGHDGGSSSFYLWLRDLGEATPGWELAARLAGRGVLVAPGDLYGSDGAQHVRLALTLTDAQVGQMIERLTSGPSHGEKRS